MAKSRTLRDRQVMKAVVPDDKSNKIDSYQDSSNDVENTLNQSNKNVRTIKPNSRQRTCKVCQRSVLGSNLSKHMKVHNSVGRPFACVDGCPQTYFLQQKDLTQHVLKIHRSSNEPVSVLSTNEEPLPFEIVDNEITSKPLVPEVNDESSPRLAQRKPPNPCKICGEPNKGNHMATHNPAGRPFTCTMGCERKYCTSASALATHITRVHATQNKRPVVEKVVMESQLVKRPRLSTTESTKSDTSLPTEKKPRKSAGNICQICGEPNHGTHMKIHDPTGRPIECKKCCIGTYFATPRGLEAHEFKFHRDQAEADEVAEEDVVGEEVAEEDVVQQVVAAAPPIKSGYSKVVHKTEQPSQVPAEKVEENPENNATTKSAETPTDTSKRRRQSIAAMLLDLPDTATDDEKLKLLDLIRICDRK